MQRDALVVPHRACIYFCDRAIRLLIAGITHGSVCFFYCNLVGVFEFPCVF